MFAKICLLAATLVCVPAQYQESSLPSYSHPNNENYQHSSYPQQSNNQHEHQILHAPIENINQHAIQNNHQQYASIEQNNQKETHHPYATIKQNHHQYAPAEQNHHRHAPIENKINYENHYQYAPIQNKATHVAPALFKPRAQNANNNNKNEASSSEDNSEQHKEETHENSHPRYVFEYSVNDAEHHDIHSQHEERDGDVVKGVYSLVQPDGVTRIVYYTADKNGFNPHVEYSGHASHQDGEEKADVGSVGVSTQKDEEEQSAAYKY